LDYKTNIEVVVKIGKEENRHVFENEFLTINRTGHLWFKNISESESELLEQIKVWYEMDKVQGKTTYYNFKTSELTSVNSSITYKVDSINEETGAILFGEM